MTIRTGARVALVTTAVLSLGLAGCEREVWGPDELLGGTSTQHEKLVERGRDRYATYCAGCHGDDGGGEGPAARFLNPKPRDLRLAKVKFAAVPAGAVPRDVDIIKTLDHGLHGTSMPAWSLLPVDDKQAIVAFIKTLSPAWEKPAASPVPIKADPWQKRPADGVAEGERVYHGIAACSSCHPAYVTHERIAQHMQSFELPVSIRPDIYHAIPTKSDWGGPITPPDFLVDRTKRAQTKDELIEVIAAGVGGTAMPSWGEALEPKQLWGLAYYVESLIQKRGSNEARETKAKLLAQGEPGGTP